ncbi:MAG: polysaccharide biosynthesis tyrosine autokinase [Cytophagales bacterium]|nr:polysaccharide biosynthesis tyrosine autokinase [Cytophagales bacterium]
MEPNHPISTSADSSNPVDSFDLGKMLFTLRRSIIWIILFVVLGITGAYLIVRYTKPLYESSSVIKLDFESEANTLGLVTNGQLQQDKGISGEIEILRSNLFLRKVVEAIDYDVSYHYYGRYLSDERFGNSPFIISHKVKNASFYDRPLDITLISDAEFEIKLSKDGESIIKGRFGQDIVTEDLNLLVEKSKFYDQSLIGDTYFFIINSDNALIKYLQANSTVQPENFSAQTIRISLKDFNRVKARAFLTAMDTLYLEYTKDQKNKTIDQKIAFLDEQIAETENQIQEYENYFEEIIIENKTLSLEGDLARTLQEISLLDSQQLNIESKKEALDQLITNLISDESIRIDAYTLEQFPGFLQSAVKAYQEEITNRSEKLSSYNENTYVIEQIDHRISIQRKTLLQSLDQFKKGLDDAFLELSVKRLRLEDSFSQLPSMGREYNKIRSLFNMQENFLMGLRQSKMELELTKAGTVTNGTLLSPASSPATPIKPQKLLILGAGFVISITISMLFLVIRYLLNNHITSAKELEKLIPVPILGTVPFYTKEKLPLTKLIVNKGSKSALSESLRTIRTNMDFLNVDKEAKTVTITSTISGEGKTFVAVNLGAIIASTNKKVCIIDLDLRKPKVHMAFEQEARPYGSSTYLIGKSKFEDCIETTAVENLFYFPAGPTPPNPSELVLSDKFDEFLQRLKEEFDFIIFDTPPVGLVTDAILVMKKTDLQFYVVKSQYSRRAFTRTITDLVRVNKFSSLTVIFNGVKSGYGYGYGYGNYGYGGYGYGGYGYGYYEESAKPKGKIASIISSLF